MKRLILVRHAKSSWAEAGLDDHDRPLNRRGEHDAPAMGEELARRKIKPDQLVSSTALRAWTTAKIVGGKLGVEPGEIVREHRIYGASVRTLFEVVQNLDEDLGCVMLFGHNPGFEELADALLPSHAVGHVPTCGVVIIDLKAEHWGAVGEGDGKLVEFLCPKMLEGKA